MFIYSILLILSTLLISQNVYDGHVLYTPGGINQNGASSYLKDVDGSIYNSWSHETGPASMPYLLEGNNPGFENTLLYYPCKSDNPTMNSGGVGGRIEIYNWDGDMLWSYDVSDDLYQHHHDIDVLPDGNILLISWERKYSSEWSSMGRTSVNNNLNQMWSETIFEIEPNLNNGETTIVWEWHLWDHLIQNISTNYDAYYGQISDHPELMDINCGGVGSNGGPGGVANGDWMHFNAIDYNADLDQIVLSSRHQGEIYIIDHSTTTEEAASHSGGNTGMGGDFLYRWGNPGNYDRGNNADQILDSQHSVNWIESNCPGAGNLILFNNNHSSQSSAALEFAPPLNNNNTYTILDDNPYGPASWTWLHQQSGIFSDVQSGAFRLPNGNTLITDANDAYVFEINEGGDTVWSYEYPGNNSMIARAQKYGYDYFNSTSILGDINEDGIINILDVILTVNIVLNGSEFSSNADLNSDGIINILDIVSLVNIILGIS